MSVTLDTNVLIWGLKFGSGNTAPRVAEMQRRAGILLADLEQDRETIVVPNIVVAELLLAIDPKEHGKFIGELQSRFFIPSFDLRAVPVAAALWQAHRKLPKADQISRTVLKADAMIIATAKVSGVKIFYSEDRKARILASLADLTACDLPTRSKNLFPPQIP